MSQELFPKHLTPPSEVRDAIRAELAQPNVSYSQGSEGDHVFKGDEDSLRQQIDLLDMSINDEPQFHLATGAKLDNAMKNIFASSGEHVGYLYFRDGEWVVVLKALAIAEGGAK